MTTHHFLSYSSADGRTLAVQVCEALLTGPEATPVWLDVNELKPGKDWEDQIVDALRSCRDVLFLMTSDSVTSQSVCKKEWSRALTYNKPVIPLLAHDELEVPLRLQDRQYLDFTGDFSVAVDRLRKHLAWQESPAGILQALRDRLADAQHELRRVATPARRQRIEDDIVWLESQVEEQERLMSDPQAAARRVDQQIARGLEQEREPQQSPPASQHAMIVNAPPAVAPAHFQGRQAETTRLAGFLQDDAQRLLIIVGRGGAGKTVLACRVLQTLDSPSLPWIGHFACEGVVYLGGNSPQRLRFANLYADLCRLLPDEASRKLDHLARDAQGPGFDPSSLPDPTDPGGLATIGGRGLLLIRTFMDEVSFNERGNQITMIKRMLRLHSHSANNTLNRS